MTGICRASKSVVTLSVAVLTVLTAGCAIDDVEFNGGLFNAVGLGGNKVKAAEPKLAERAPLVVPPTLDRIPEPGAPPETTNDAVASLNDPDKAAKVSKEELERQQAEYCKKNYELAKTHGDETGADLAVGPLGPCKASVLTAIKKWGADDEEQQ
jgi:hypothetical protein